MIAIVLSFLKGIPLKVWIALAIAVLCASVVLGAYHRGRLAERADWEVAIAVQKAEADRLWVEENAKAKATEAELAALKQKTEADHAQWKRENDDLSRRIAALGERLRDPGRRPSGGGTETASAGATGQCGEGTEGTGLLSAQLSGFLRERFLEADMVLDDLHACRNYALGLIEAWPK